MLVIANNMESKGCTFEGERSKDGLSTRVEHPWFLSEQRSAQDPVLNAVCHVMYQDVLYILSAAAPHPRLR